MNQQNIPKENYPANKMITITPFNYWLYRLVQTKSVPLATMSPKRCQCSIVTHLKCGGIITDNCMPNHTVKDTLINWSAFCRLMGKRILVPSWLTIANGLTETEVESMFTCRCDRPPDVVSSSCCESRQPSKTKSSLGEQGRPAVTQSFEIPMALLLRVSRFKRSVTVGWIFCLTAQTCHNCRQQNTTATN